MGLCLEKEQNTSTQSSNRKSISVDAQQIKIDNQPLYTISLQDFDLVKVIGRGSFGKVILVQHKISQQYFAMKVLRKDVIEQKNQKEHTQNEREILSSSNHPFIVKLHFAFQTNEKLYLVTDFMQGGELFLHLRKSYKFSEERAKLYVAEIVLALEYLHEQGVIYRDLKPENILLGADGHIKLTDFGLSKTNLKEGEFAYSLCGTPEYLAPEILEQNGHDRGADWWSLGALLYEMLSGVPPFYSQNKALMFKNRLEKPIEMKQWFSEDVRSLLKGLLENDPKKRLRVKEIKEHKFFEGLDWQKVYRKEIEPLFIPRVKDDLDLQNIDRIFTDEKLQDTPIAYSKKDMYEKFTYKNQELMFKQ